MPTLIDFAAPHVGAARWRGAFAAPVQTLVAHQLHEVPAVLDAVQAAAQAGRWCVGYVRYEAAAAWDAALTTHPADGPLAWFGVHEQMLPWPETVAEAATEAATPVQADWQPTLSRSAFEAAMAAIHQAIAAGDIYQLNYTAPWQATLQGTPQALFAALHRAQPGGYAAYIDTGAEQVLSVSPELFFDWDGQHILARPMKGTAPRGATPADDAQRAAQLRASAKERAENVMIVDLIRNDLSRIAEPFSVQVPALFQTQALPSVWQMTSDVTARTRPGTTLAQVFGALFPCGSITGAPKVRAMQLIRQLEAGPRGVYCGAVGVVRPGGAATFNVAIRTVTVTLIPVASTADPTAMQPESSTNTSSSPVPSSIPISQARCGIGSGITADAAADAEWQEWRHKRAFLERASRPFSLLETLALDGGQLRHRADHLARLARAAAHFGYPWHAETVNAALDELTAAHPSGLWRVRLLLNAQGQPEAQAYAMEASLPRVRLALAASAFEQADSEFVRYKTTRRAHYDAAAPSAASGLFDTLLWNRHGELTECTRGNIAVELDGRWLTPPLHCGLLDGVGRAVALRQGRLSEAVLCVDDLPRATGVAFINSLRGWIDAEVVTGA